MNESKPARLLFTVCRVSSTWMSQKIQTILKQAGGLPSQTLPLEERRKIRLELKASLQINLQHDISIHIFWQLDTSLLKAQDKNLLLAPEHTFSTLLHSFICIWSDSCCSCLHFLTEFLNMEFMFFSTSQYKQKHNRAYSLVRMLSDELI